MSTLYSIPPIFKMKCDVFFKRRKKKENFWNVDYLIGDIWLIWWRRTYQASSTKAINLFFFCWWWSGASNFILVHKIFYHKKVSCLPVLSAYIYEGKKSLQVSWQINKVHNNVGREKKVHKSELPGYVLNFKRLIFETLCFITLLRPFCVPCNVRKR